MQSLTQIIRIHGAVVILRVHWCRSLELPDTTARILKYVKQFMIDRLAGPYYWSTYFIELTLVVGSDAIAASCERGIAYGIHEDMRMSSGFYLQVGFPSIYNYQTLLTEFMDRMPSHYAVNRFECIYSPEPRVPGDDVDAVDMDTLFPTAVIKRLYPKNPRGATCIMYNLSTKINKDVDWESMLRVHNKLKMPWEIHETSSLDGFTPVGGRIGIWQFRKSVNGVTPIVPIKPVPIV